MYIHVLYICVYIYINAYIYIYCVCTVCGDREGSRETMSRSGETVSRRLCARMFAFFFQRPQLRTSMLSPAPSAARGHPRAAIRRLRSPDTAVSCIPGDLLACMAQRQELHLAVVAAHPQEQLRAYATSAAVQQRQHIPTTTPQAVVHAFSKQSNDIVSIRRAPEPYDILQYREGYDLMKQS